MMRRIAPIYLLFIGLFLVTGCTNAKLEKLPAKAALQRDDKLAISGEICTLDPETLTFPLRVIFVVDSSVSMEITDPPDPITGETGRERAVRETWTRLLDQGAAGARFSVIRFSSQAQPLTGTDLNGDGAVDTYFSADRARLSQATQALGVTDRTTNYINALGEAYYEIRTELVQAEQESLPLSNYQVIFLSDGLPDVDSTEDRGNSNENILEAVEALRELTETFKVGKFGFHTAYLASQNATFNEQATSLLQGMADVGGGNFRSFPNGEQLNFLFVDFTVLKRIFTLRALIGTNQNAVLSVAQIPEWAKKPEPVDEEPTPDAGDGDITEDDAGADVSEESDADGDAGADSDVEEVVVPTLHPYSFSDINGDGYPGCGEPLSDTDGDGLSDMAELALGSDPLVPDTDDDGLSDFLEWSYRESGFDLLDPSDARCYVPEVCENLDENGVCECLFDANSDGICDCVDDPNLTCVDDIGSDCVDLDADGFCDCPDLNNDGRCDYEDSDNDGLNDCEEVFYGSAQNGVDSDADGLPDRIEVRFGTSPVENDLNGDLDADSTSNGIEVLSNTDPLCDDSETRSRGAYQYELKKTGIDAGRTCYTFKVENITLLPTLENPAATYPGNGWNRILVYAGGVAFDSPNSFARYRVACVMANYYPDGNYRNPPSGRVQLDESDFVEVADFNADEDCKWP